MAVKKFRYGVSQEESKTGFKTMDVDELTNMPMSKALLYLDKLVSGRTRIFRDRIPLAGGTPLLEGKEFLAFSRGQEDEGYVWNVPATTFQKNRADTNMRKGGRFEAKTTIVVIAIEAHIPVPARAATTYSAKLLVTNPAPAAKAATTHSAHGLLSVIQHQIGWQWRYGTSTLEESGLLLDIPSSCGGSESHGGDAEEGGALNTLGVNRQLDFPKVYTHEDSGEFDVMMQCVETFTPTINQSIYMRLICKELFDVF